jgi:hypothetical protein
LADKDIIYTTIQAQIARYKRGLLSGLAQREPPILDGTLPLALSSCLDYFSHWGLFIAVTSM